MSHRLAMLKRAVDHAPYTHVHRRLSHAVARPPPLSAAIDQPAASPPLSLPKTDPERRFVFGFPSFGFLGGAMELMAVPKKKTSPHKRGIRNGPKALKPVPVIVRCKACGRVKLQHFFCCSGLKEHTEEQNK